MKFTNDSQHVANDHEDLIENHCLAEAPMQLNEPSVKKEETENQVPKYKLMA